MQEHTAQKTTEVEQSWMSDYGTQNDMLLQMKE